MYHGKISAGPGKPNPKIFAVFSCKKIKIILNLSIDCYREIILDLFIGIFDCRDTLFPFTKALQIFQLLVFGLLRFRLNITLQSIFLLRFANSLGKHYGLLPQGRAHVLWT